MSEKYQLSRRKALAALGTIGVAGAGAGMGTSALLGDEEGFENNTITAGTLDMAVEGEIVATNDEYESAVADITGNPIEADGDVEMGFDVADFKPGDWFIVCITVDSVAENPFYLTLFAENLTEGPGDTTEPEQTPDDGELGANLLTTVWGNLDGGGRGADRRFDLRNLDETAEVSGASGLIGSNTYYNEEPDTDGNAEHANSVNVEYTTTRELVDGYGGSFNGWGSPDGILVREGNGDAAEIGSGSSDFSGSILSDPDGDDEGELVFYVLFELPAEVGNEVQGDELSLDLRFSAEQVRNNDDPRSGN